MDPDLMRNKMIELANLTLAMTGRVEHPSKEQLALLADQAEMLSEAVHDLDTWLRHGGFLPDVWVKGSENASRMQTT